jgi:GH3 auxin-responsive promoter
LIEFSEILLLSVFHAATEAIIGINLWPHVQPVRYILLPEMLFYEFIPADKSNETQPDTLLMHQVLQKCSPFLKQDLLRF